MEAGFKYILSNGGIDSEQDYNYTAKDGVCWTAAEKRVVATINNFTDVKNKDETQMQAAIMINPVSIAIEADHPYFQHYKSGTLDNATACGDKLDHGVLIVGMTDDAYIVKNSWGPPWGQQG
jgi:C1A family cysteine protease